jgi:hypothetical protein
LIDFQFCYSAAAGGSDRVNKILARDVCILIFVVVTHGQSEADRTFKTGLTGAHPLYFNFKLRANH